jgi:DNA recombination protein RmuC
MDYTLPFLFLTSGFVGGGAIVWLLLRSKIQHSYERAKAESASERAALIERSRDREAQAHYFCNVVRERDAQIADLRAANENLRAKVAEFETQLREEQKITQEKLRPLDEAQQKLLDAFSALSAEALENSRYLK